MCGDAKKCKNKCFNANCLLVLYTFNQQIKSERERVVGHGERKKRRPPKQNKKKKVSRKRKKQKSCVSRESNPGPMLGRQGCCLYTTDAHTLLTLLTSKSNCKLGLSQFSKKRFFEKKILHCKWEIFFLPIV